MLRSIKVFHLKGNFSFSEDELITDDHSNFLKPGNKIC